ncbi:MAG: hypothetical protein ACR2QT_10475 [Woeseiaceae bacterium]
MIDFRSLHRRAALVGFVFALLFAWACYRPAVTGAFQLDDFSNLGGLSRVSDLDTALDFMISGRAGPLGRPISLATFAAQADSWAQGASAFLEINFLIHLLNAVLVAFCMWRLALQMSIERTRAMNIAALAASAWVLMPLLATASMLVVQRMTTLSATFVLVGLAAYLLARTRIAERPRAAMLGMSISLVLGTLFAMLCKESGLLLPVYILVLEATVLTRPDSIQLKRWRTWQALFLLTPLIVVVAYLGSQLSYADWMVQRRGFTASERLLTEAQLLWVYLSKAVLGLPDKLGIFRGPPSLAQSLFQPLTILATLSWLALAVASIVWRRRYPLAALAVLWFLVGHLLESTVVPLELYFEHRNYLPIVGPLFALSAAVLLAGHRVRIAGLSAIVALIAVNAGFLYMFASLWGEPSSASRHWALRHPDSVRAVTTMATFQLAEEGPLRTLRTIDQFVARNPQHAYLRLQELNLLCRYSSGSDHSSVLQELDRQLGGVDFTFTAGTMLSQLFDAAVATNCPGVNPGTIAALAATLRNNPRYVTEPGYNQFHQKLLASIARYQGDDGAAIDHLRAAIDYRPSSELNMMMVTLLGGQGDFDAARKFIDDARADGPLNPLHAYQWRRDLDGLHIYTEELEKVKQ